MHSVINTIYSPSLKYIQRNVSNFLVWHLFTPKRYHSSVRRIYDAHYHGKIYDFLNLLRRIASNSFFCLFGEGIKFAFFKFGCFPPFHSLPTKSVTRVESTNQQQNSRFIDRFITSNIIHLAKFVILPRNWILNN